MRRFQRRSLSLDSYQRSLRPLANKCVPFGNKRKLGNAEGIAFVRRRTIWNFEFVSSVFVPDGNEFVNVGLVRPTISNFEFVSSVFVPEENEFVSRRSFRPAVAIKKNGDAEGIALINGNYF